MNAVMADDPVAKDEAADKVPAVTSVTADTVVLELATSPHTDMLQLVEAAAQDRR